MLLLPLILAFALRVFLQALPHDLEHNPSWTGMTYWCLSLLTLACPATPGPCVHLSFVFLQALPHDLEHKTILGSHDIVVPVQGGLREVAIEVDGPFHYAKNQ